MSALHTHCAHLSQEIYHNEREVSPQRLCCVYVFKDRRRDKERMNVLFLHLFIPSLTCIYTMSLIPTKSISRSWQTRPLPWRAEMWSLLCALLTKYRRWPQNVCSLMGHPESFTKEISLLTPKKWFTYKYVSLNTCFLKAEATIIAMDALLRALVKTGFAEVKLEFKSNPDTPDCLQRQWSITFIANIAAKMRCLDSDLYKTPIAQLCKPGSL